MPAGPPGNKSGLALKDPEMRQRAYLDFCEHLAQGFSQDAWSFEEDGYTCCWYTMLKYLKDKDEFDPIHKIRALARSKKKWEGVCFSSAEGTNEKANTASLQMIMRNKFGWDKKEKEDELGSQQAIELLDKFTDILNKSKDPEESDKSTS